jgi:CheY-like chemotaxis protein/signal transduction histidine kinase
VYALFSHPALIYGIWVSGLRKFAKLVITQQYNVHTSKRLTALKLFITDCKAKKNRANMLETDSRLAKYSRRGLISSFCAYVICLVFGEFFEVAKEKAVVLGAGLLLVTLIRGYFLFRFDALYARGPSSWRNRYFLASFLGAIWWSVILVSMTLEMGMNAETPIIWLYTVVFGSSMAGAFAPYSRFLVIYLALSQLPAAFAAMTLGTMQGYLFGIMMVVFFANLSYQGRASSRSYWQHLEANMALRHRAENLEEVNLGSRAAMNFRDEFLGKLSLEFRTSLNDVLGALTLLGNSPLNEQQKDWLNLAEHASERQLDLVDNVMDYSRIAAKELVLDVAVFNLPRHLENLMEETSSEAYQHGIEVSYAFSDELPSRVKGDALRFGKVVSYLVSHAVQFSVHSHLHVEGTFKYEDDQTGELKLVISDGFGMDDVEASQLTNSITAETREPGEGGVALSICQGLAECMDGFVIVNVEPGRGVELRLNIRFPIADQKPWRMNASPKLKGKRLLLISPPKQIDESLIMELSQWELQLEQVEGTEQALRRLDEGVEAGKAFDGLVLWSEGTDTGLLGFSDTLAKDKQHGDIKQVIALSPLLRHAEEISQHRKAHPQVRFVGKPLIKQRLHDALMDLWFSSDSGGRARATQQAFDRNSMNQDKTILLVEDDRVNQMVAKSLLNNLGYQVEMAVNGREALNVLKQKQFDLVLMDCQMPEMDGYCATREFRKLEEHEALHTPVIAMTAHTEEGIQSRCLAAGMDDYLSKPVRLDELERRLRRWLG